MLGPMRLLLCSLLALAGCAAPFTEVNPGDKKSGELVLTYCGASTVTAGGVIKAMDEPPIGGEQDTMKPQPMRVCLRLANHGSGPAKVDRSHLKMETQHGKESMIPDKDDDVFMVPPGQTRDFGVDFETNLVLSGEDVKIRVGEAITVGGHGSQLTPIVLRKK